MLPSSPTRLLLAVVIAATPLPAQNPVLAPAPPAARPTGPPPGRNAGGRPVHNEAERAARWKPFPCPTTNRPHHARAADDREAGRRMPADGQLYLHASDLGGYEMYHTTQSAELLQLFAINGSRWDLVDGNSPFIGEEPLVRRHELYPFGLTSAAIEQYVAAHPDERAAIYSPWTVVRSAPLDIAPALSQPVVYGTPEASSTRYPYHVAYAQWLKPMAEDLRSAAKLSPDPAFAHYLTLRADALLTDDYLRFRHRVARPERPKDRSDLRALRDLPRRRARRENLVRRLHPDSQRCGEPQAGHVSAARGRDAAGAADRGRRRHPSRATRRRWR